MARFVTLTTSQKKSTFLKTNEEPRLGLYASIPGMRTSLLWTTTPHSRMDGDFVDGALEATSFVPAPGGTSFLMITLPPLQAFIDADPMVAAAEHLAMSPGIAEALAADVGGFHTTPTTDYVIIMSGEIWLETDLEERKLTAGDVVIQNGTRHAWQNRTDQPATIAVILVGQHSN